MKPIIIYESASSDGYTHQGDGRMFLTVTEASIAGRQKYGGYAVDPIMHHALPDGTGRYYLLKKATPISLSDSKQATENLTASALKKLSAEERIALGLKP